MPTVFSELGYRFFFYSNERNEPPHIHVEKGDAAAKWWIQPLTENWSSGFSAADRRKIRDLLQRNTDLILERWNEHFGTNR